METPIACQRPAAIAARPAATPAWCPGRRTSTSGDNGAVTHRSAAMGRIPVPPGADRSRGQTVGTVSEENRPPRSPNSPRHSPAAAMEKRRSAKNASFSIGMVDCALPRRRRRQEYRGWTRPRAATRGEVQPSGGRLDNRPEQQAQARPIDSRAPTGSGRQHRFLETRAPAQGCQGSRQERWGR